MDTPPPLFERNDLNSPTTSMSQPMQPQRPKPRRKPLPKRLDFIPKDLQMQLFPNNGDRILKYKRQSKAKSSKERRKPRKSTSEAAFKPTTGISPTPSISDVRQFDHSSSYYPNQSEDSTITDPFHRSTPASPFSDFSSNQASVYEVTHLQGQGCSAGPLYIPTTSHTSTAIAPSHLFSMIDHYSNAEFSIPQNDQSFQNSGFMPTVYQVEAPSSEPAPFDFFSHDSAAAEYSTCQYQPIRIGHNLYGAPPEFNGAGHTDLSFDDMFGQQLADVFPLTGQGLTEPVQSLAVLHLSAHELQIYFNGQLNQDGYTDSHQQ